MAKLFRIIIHSLVAALVGMLLGLFFWNLKYNEFPTFVETCRKLAEVGGVQAAALTGIFSLALVWLVTAEFLRRLRGEVFCDASGKVIKSFLPFLLLFLLFAEKWSGIQTDFVVIAFIFSCSLTTGLLASLFIEFERVQTYDGFFKIILLVLIVLASVWFIHIVMIDFNDFRFLDEDFLAFDSSIRSVLRGQCLRSSVHDNKSQLGCHFSPILFLIAPFYLIFDNPRTLIFFQVVPVVASAFIVYLLAKEKLWNPLLALCFGTGYLLLPHVHSAAFNEFHAANMIPPFVMLTFYFLIKRNFRAYWISLLLMISCREELFLTGAAIGIIAFFLPWKTVEEKEQNRRTGLTTFLICFVLGMIVVKYVIPYCAGTTGKGHPDYPLFDEQWGPHRWRSLCFTFLPMVLLPFFGGITLLLPFAAIGVPLMSQNHYLFRLAMQYSASVSPSVAISAIFGASYVISFSTGPSELKRTITGFLGHRSAMSIIGVGLFTSCLLYSVFFGYLPFSRDFDQRGNVFCGPVERPFKKNIRVSDQSGVILDFIKMIPKDASVCTHPRIGHHVSHHPNFQRFSGYNEHVYGSNRCEYVLLNIKWQEESSRERSPDLIQLLRAGEYGVLGYKDWALLLKSNHTTLNNEWAYREIFLSYDGHRLVSEGCPMVSDSDAIDGRARFASPGKDEDKYVALTTDKKCFPGKYVVDFLMKVSVVTTERITRIDCIRKDGAGTVAERYIRGTYFDEGGKYKRLRLAFDLPETAVLQFRVMYFGHTRLWVDRIEIRSEALSLRGEYKRLKH